MKKRFVFVIMTLAVLFGQAISVSAYTITSNDGREINIQGITEEQVPENIIPIKFDTQEEAEEFLKVAFTSLNNNRPSILRDTFGDAYVDSAENWLGKVELRLSYGTTQSGSRGTISFHDPYVRYTGITFGSSWQTANMGSSVTSSGKDVYAYCNGQINYNFSVGGGQQVGSAPISLAGTVWVIR